MAVFLLGIVAVNAEAPGPNYYLKYYKDTDVAAKLWLNGVPLDLHFIVAHDGFSNTSHSSGVEELNRWIIPGENILRVQTKRDKKRIYTGTSNPKLRFQIIRTDKETFTYDDDDGEEIAFFDSTQTPLTQYLTQYFNKVDEGVGIIDESLVKMLDEIANEWDKGDAADQGRIDNLLQEGTTTAQTNIDALRNLKAPFADVSFGNPLEQYITAIEKFLDANVDFVAAVKGKNTINSKSTTKIFNARVNAYDRLEIFLYRTEDLFFDKENYKNNNQIKKILFSVKQLPPDESWKESPPLTLSEENKKAAYAVLQRVYTEREALIRDNSDLYLLFLKEETEKFTPIVMEIFKMLRNIKEPMEGIVRNIVVDRAPMNALKYELSLNGHAIHIIRKNGKPAVRTKWNAVVNHRVFNLVFEESVFVAPINGKWELVISQASSRLIP